MIPVRTIRDLEEEIASRKSSKVIGFRIAPYNREEVKRIVDQYYKEWHFLRGENFDLFWLAYGEYGIDESPNQIILELAGKNEELIYFDLELFQRELREFNEKVEFKATSDFELILFDSYKGKINYRKHFRIEFDEYSKENIGLINKIINAIVDNVSDNKTIQEIKKKVKIEIGKSKLKKIKISDLISVFGLFGG